MNNKFIIAILFATYLLIGCKKSDTGYTAAQVFTNTESPGNCGYLLSIQNEVFAPINLPIEYQKYSGIKGENIIYVKYSIKEGFLNCFDSIGQRRIEKTYRLLEIQKILE